MTQTSLQQVIDILNNASVRYLVVGGVAVNAHGYVRLTVDVDLLIQLTEPNIIAALHALATLGYKPSIPVTFEQFADQATRERWIVEKGMKVLKLHSDAHRETVIDIFVSDPLGFDDAYQRVFIQKMGANTTVPICGYDDLVKLKLQASRPKDLSDLEFLRKSRGVI